MTMTEQRSDHPRRGNAVIVVMASLSRLTVWADGHVAVLSPAEKARAARYRFERDRLNFMASRLVLRSVLRDYLAVPADEIVFDEWCRQCSRGHAKPSVVEAPPSFDFSLSRSGDIVLVAVGSAGRIGVDVEHVEPDLPVAGLAKSVMSYPEQGALALDPPWDRAMHFLHSWARKEAYAKATGYGLALPLGDITFAGEGRERFVLLAGRTGWAGRTLDLAPMPGYAGAVARVGVDGGPIRVEERVFEPEDLSLR